MPKLLLADHSTTVQRIVELTFLGQDVQVLCVADGEEAVARIAADRPDVVLADISLPGRSGYDVAAFVKARADLAHIPVLLLAGAFEPVDAARASEAVCQGVLVKPLEPNDLIVRIREALDPDRARRAAAGEARVMDALEASPAANAPLVNDALDLYFEQLDAAFDRLERDRRVPPRPDAAPPLLEPEDELGVPTLDQLLARADDGGARMSGEPPARELPVSGAFGGREPSTSAVHAGEESAPAPPAEGAAHSVLADAFSALLAAEQGGAAPGASPQPGANTEELVAEVTRRVLERLASESAKSMMAPVVSEVAERLVREEIARIRSKT